MKQEKLTYERASLEIALIGAEDIVTASTADSFEFVDQNAWDS